MNAVDTLSLIGELLSWVGILVGIPFLIIMLLIRVIDGRHKPTNITIVAGFDDQQVAFWNAGERTLTCVLPGRPMPSAGSRQELIGYVSQRDPQRMRFEKRHPADKTCGIVAAVMFITAAVGFIVSLLSLFW